MPPRTKPVPAVSSSPPPPLYDTSISTHEETSWHSSSYQSRGESVGGVRTPGGTGTTSTSWVPATTSPHGGGGAPVTAPAALSPHYHRGWFPKSHPKSPRYDPRAFRRDEHHRPVHSEPIDVLQRASNQDPHPSRFRKSQRGVPQQRGGGGGDDYPDPEPNLLSLESTHDDDDDDEYDGIRASIGGGAARGPTRRLPVFTVDGIASEVALGSRYSSRVSPSRALTRDLLSRLDARRYHKNQQNQQNQNQQQQLFSDRQPALPGGIPSRRDAPPSNAGAAADDAPSRGVRERVSAAAATRRSWKEDDASKPSGRESPGRQTPPPPETDEAPADNNRGTVAARGSDWQRRAEIETPEPARVTDLKQRLWDDRESLHNKSPVVHRHVDLHYDRQGLNQRWKQWHGEGDKDRGLEELTPARANLKPAAAAAAATTADSNRRSRSLSPGTAASGARSRTPPPPALPLTPAASVYSTPKPHQVFQSRFVQAAHRASPAAPHSHSSRAGAATPTSTKPVVPAAGTLGSGPRRDESAFVLSSPVSTKSEVGRETAAKPAVTTPGPTPWTPTMPRAAVVEPSPADAQALAARPGEELSASSVADLVARLQKVRRENPDQALAEIDAIIQQSQGAPPAEKAPAADRLGSTKSVKQAGKGTVGAPNLARDDEDDTKYWTTCETPRNGPDQPYENQRNKDLVEQDDGDDMHDGSDDDETSVSSITNPTYGVVGSEYHHPRPTVLSTLKGAGQPRPSALSNYNARSSLRTTELQQPAYGRSRRQARHRSPPPASIHVTREAGNTDQSYQQLHDDEDNELDAVLGTAQNATNVEAARKSEGTTSEQVNLQHQPVKAVSRAQQPPQASLVAELRSSTARKMGETAPGTNHAEGFPVSTDAPVASSEEKGAPSIDPANLTVDPSNSAELAQKIKKWDDMSEPDFCPVAGCLNSKSSDQDLRRSAPLMADSLVEMVCPRDEDASAMKRRHHPWDASIPVCMGQVSVHETSMDQAVGVEAEYSMKYQDARSEMSVSVEASSGGGKKTRRTAQEKSTESRGGKNIKAGSDGERREGAVLRGDAFDINPRLVSPDSAGESGTGFSSEHQAYARNLAEDFDSAWVSLPSSAFFRDGQQDGLRTYSNDSDKLPSQAKVLSVSKQGESSSPRRPHHDQYQTFRAREGGRKTEHTNDGVSGNPRTTKTFELTGIKQGENGGFEVVILNDVQQKVATSIPTSSDASRSRRGLRKFLKQRQAGRKSSLSQGSVSTSSRSQLQSVSLDLQSASLDTEAAEAPPPPLRGRSQHDDAAQSPDRLRSRSLDERRIRNPHIAKKFSRLLRVYEENPSKQFGII